MLKTYQGVVHDGQLKLDDEAALPEGARFTLLLADDDQADIPEGITGEQILQSGIVGLWAHRDDITDSAAFAEQLRRSAEQHSQDA